MAMNMPTPAMTMPSPTPMADDHSGHMHGMPMPGMPPSNATPFCLGDGYVMQNGFQLAFGDGQYCALFLFKGWALDTAGKYTGAVIFTFCIGLLLECFSFCRRLYAQQFLSPEPADTNSPDGVPEDDRGAAPSAHALTHYVSSALYAAQMVLAYWAMLLAMLYESVIFTALILGFLVGHALFSVFLPYKLGVGREAKRRPAAEKPHAVGGAGSPCCAGTHSSS